MGIVAGVIILLLALRGLRGSRGWAESGSSADFVARSPGLYRGAGGLLALSIRAATVQDESLISKREQ